MPLNKIMSLSVDGTYEYLNICEPEKDLLVNKIYDTTVCKLLLSYMN